jgi:hypothetical protein
VERRGAEVVEHEIVHPHDAVHGARRGAAELARCRPPQRGVAEQAQCEAVQRAARGGLAEVRDRLPSQTAVKKETAEGLVAGLAAIAGPAPDVQAPAVLEDGPGAVRAVSRPKRPVRADHDGGGPLRVALVDAPDANDPVAMHQLASAPGEQRDVVAVADIEAVHDGPPLQRGGQIPRREEARAPLEDGLVAHPRVGYVAEFVLALLRHGALGFDDGRERLARQDNLRSALEEIGRHLLTQLRLHRVHLPALVVGEVRGCDAPAGARVAELAHDESPGDTVHLDEPLPRMTTLQQGSDMVLGQEGDAKRVHLETNVLGKPAGIRPDEPCWHRDPPVLG